MLIIQGSPRDPVVVPPVLHHHKVHPLSNTPLDSLNWIWMVHSYLLMWQVVLPLWGLHVEAGILPRNVMSCWAFKDVIVDKRHSYWRVVWGWVVTSKLLLQTTLMPIGFIGSRGSNHATLSHCYMWILKESGCGWGWKVRGRKHVWLIAIDYHAATGTAGTGSRGD